MSVADSVKELLSIAVPYSGKLHLSKTLEGLLIEKATAFKGTTHGEMLRDMLKGLGKLKYGKPVTELTHAESYSIGRLPSFLGKEVHALGNGETLGENAYSFMSDSELVRRLKSRLSSPLVEVAEITEIDAANHRDQFLHVQGKAIDLCKKLGCDSTFRGK